MLRTFNIVLCFIAFCAAFSATAAEGAPLRQVISYPSAALGRIRDNHACYYPAGRSGTSYFVKATFRRSHRRVVVTEVTEENLQERIIDAEKKVDAGRIRARSTLATLEKLLRRLRRCLGTSNGETPTPTPSSTSGDQPTPTPTATPTASSTATPSSWPSATVTTVSSLTFNSITVDFAAPVQVAYYATGEPAVRMPFTISSVSPAPEYQFRLGTVQPFAGLNPPYCISDAARIEQYCTEYNALQWTATCHPNDNRYCQYQRIRNGAQVNPLPNDVQAFDSRGSGASTSVGIQFPFTPVNSSIQSLVLTKSNLDEGTCSICPWCSPAWSDWQGACNWAAVQQGFVLTAIPNQASLWPPAQDELRPPYSGNNKPRFYLRNLNTNLFSSIPPVTNPAPPTIANIIRSIQNTWFVHNPREGYTILNPGFNMGSYGTVVTREMGVAMWALARSDVSFINKVTVASHIAQIGIDAYYTYLVGRTLSGFVGWEGANGHGGVGRPMTIVLAGALLGVPAMRDLFVSGDAKNFFGQTCHPYYDSPSEINWGSGYSPAINGFPRLDSAGHCPVATHSTGSGGQIIPATVDTGTYNNYFYCCTTSAWRGEVGAMRALALESYFPTAMALFDIVDRTYLEGVSGHTNPWSDAMYGAYIANPTYRPLLCVNGVQNRCGGSCNSLTAPATFIGEQTGVDHGASCNN